MENQKRNPNQPQNIGKWEAWTTKSQSSSSAQELHVKGSFPADEKNPNFSLRQITSTGEGTSEIVLELDHQGINPKGKELSSIKEFKTSLGSKKYDSVIIRSKGIDHVATVPITEGPKSKRT